MNIADLVDGPIAPTPRRSPSNPHSISGPSPAPPTMPGPSPAMSAGKLPTPPLSTHTTMSRKRKRHDPKPIWAYLENEPLPPDLQAQQAQREQRQPSGPAPTTPRVQSQPLPVAQSNGTPGAPNHAPPIAMGPPPVGQPLAMATRELQGYERPIDNSPEVYDEATRKVCDFLWNNVVQNHPLRQAVEEMPNCQIEIEARWGQILEKDTKRRLQGFHATECVLREGVTDNIMFESTMSIQQHQKMNKYLNTHTQASNAPGANRPPIKYKHTREVDSLYHLHQEGFNMLSPGLRNIIGQQPKPSKIRVTRDQKTGQVTAQIIKVRIHNLEISSPATEWDYRIGINLELHYPGPVEGLQPAIERQGQTVESTNRTKDRVSYSFNRAYQVDLTQVVQGGHKNHELELELDSQVLLHEVAKIQNGGPSDYENLVGGMMNNLRVLSREMTQGKT